MGLKLLPKNRVDYAPLLMFLRDKNGAVDRSTWVLVMAREHCCSIIRDMYSLYLNRPLTFHSSVCMLLVEEARQECQKHSFTSVVLVVVGKTECMVPPSQCRIVLDSGG